MRLGVKGKGSRQGEVESRVRCRKLLASRKPPSKINGGIAWPYRLKILVEELEDEAVARVGQKEWRQDEAANKKGREK